MKVWDLPTRLYHWLQVALIIGLFVTGYQGVGVHISLGLGLVTLLIWRVSWGVIGSDTSRFSYFVQSPKTVLRYFSEQNQEKPGHNPAGGWMVILMLAILLFQCLTGLVIAGLVEKIPFSDIWLTDRVVESLIGFHTSLAVLLLVVIGLHLMAILVYKLRSKPLLWAMVIGVQIRAEQVVLSFESNKRACVVLIASVLVTIAIVALS
ncbi:hydrogenase [Shewanella psychropiezotolerans]|uniref:Hydrogenase n=1 Tax=Shewanella psychropiezotolerans TaxID=2593655 RepID=A0ABX5WZX4_9GAMM|nr:cytochrome b/b6 domain-containing protein [Shewanella psychropiezotolerans]QDO84655.1 hydrogenase [Shewanella psychropiezotolerans]